MSQHAPTQPLADRIRPQTLDEFIGQKHLVNEGKPIYQAIKHNRIHSMIFWGPPGVGKTTLARIIANHTGMQFVQISAVSAGKADRRKIVAMSQDAATPMEKLMRGDEEHPLRRQERSFLVVHVAR